MTADYREATVRNASFGRHQYPRQWVRRSWSGDSDSATMRLSEQENPLRPAGIRRHQAERSPKVFTTQYPIVRSR